MRRAGIHHWLNDFDGKYPNFNIGIDQWLFPQAVLAEGGLHPGAHNCLVLISIGSGFIEY